MIFRNVVDKDGNFCGIYKLVLKYQYQWEYVSKTQRLGLNDTYFTIRKDNDSWAYSLEEGDLDGDL